MARHKATRTADGSAFAMDSSGMGLLLGASIGAWTLRCHTFSGRRSVDEAAASGQRIAVTTLPVKIRQALSIDLEGVARLSSALWPEAPIAEHRDHAAAILSGKPPSTLPLVLFVAEIERQVVGFIEVGLRSHADGCDTSHPVGFIEGWYVEPQYQRRSVGRALMTAAEDWSRSQGARELASDTWIDEQPSQRAHEALGFEVVDRCVNFRKSLR